MFNFVRKSAASLSLKKDSITFKYNVKFTFEKVVVTFPHIYRELHLLFELVCGPQDKSTNDVDFLFGKNVTSFLV